MSCKIFMVYEDAVRNDGSVQMRGFQIFEELKGEFDIHIVSLSEILQVSPKNSILLFVKPKLYHLHEPLISHNCIIYDILDTIDGLSSANLKNITCGIFCSNKIKSELSSRFRAPSLNSTIYHHWDSRIPTFAPKANISRNLIGYFGEKQKLYHYAGIEEQVDLFFSPFSSYYDKIKDYRCHYILKPTYRARDLEPLTKIATAASVDAIVIAPCDHSQELLGISYPFYAERDLQSITQVMKRIRYNNKEEWRVAKDIMRDIKLRCSIKSIGREYSHMLKRISQSVL